MECGSCGSINRDGARFCVGCGSPLLPRCPSCGNELPIDAKFCDSCGSPLHRTIPAPDGAPTRKIVTVLFSDLTGSTALGERLDPESFRSIMTPVYASMRNEVEAKGGVVTKFVGDGVMAAFGVPDIREDDAMRAVDAAVAMQQAIARLSLDLPVGLSLKVGVNTGEVVVGVGDEDIVGDCVNVASRLEGAAAPGEVLVGEETWRLTRANATYEPVAPLSLKGKADPVPAYRLVSLERTQEARTATFVGRHQELLELRRAFDEAVERNASRLVTIVGSPGLGKTRLARELGAALAHRALVVETRCDAAGTATLAPVADALRSAADIAESATPDEVLQALRDLVPDDPDQERVAVRCAAILGAGEPGSTEETFWAIRRIVETAAKAQPMVLILDDLHWGEPLLLDLVEHLAEWNRTSPVLIVVTGRPELREMRPRLTEGAISLEGLDGAATERLACGLLGTDQVPRDLLARLPVSTEGNPLFVREFVRMLVDDGILRRSGDGWISTIDVDAIQVPPTIHSLLAARVDRLTPHERTVLELASVIGKEFYMGAIAELAPAAVKVDLSAHLESLRRKELVEPAGTYWIDEPVFRFHHALIQDAAYKRLLKESRAELHERVADWLERKTGGLIGEHDELIGYHVEQAHECRRQLGSPDDQLRELGRRAGRLLSSAARNALDLDDLPSAAGLSGRALERLEADDPDRPEVLLLRCEALLATGDVARAAEAVAELEREAASSPRLLAWATCFSGELANMTDPSRLRETERYVAVAAERFTELQDPAGAAKAYTVQAIALAGLGRVAACESALDRALNAAREAGDRRRVTAVLAFAPVAALWGPSPVSRAGGRCLDIVRLLRITTGSPAVEATSERCQAVLEAFRGRAPAARRMLERVRGKVEELGLRQGLLDTELFFGIVELVARDPSAAEVHLTAARNGFHAMGNDLGTARAAALLARALLAMEDEDAAAIYVTESERLGGDDLKNAIAWRAVRAELLARKGELDEARRLAEDAVEIASRTDALVDHADACMALAEVCRRAGDVDGARRARDAAIALYERKGATAYIEMPHSSSEPVAQVTTPPPTNRCVRALQRLLTRYLDTSQNALNEWAVDGIVDDRRPLVKQAYRGRSGAAELLSSIRAVNTATVRFEPVAVRGEDLALLSMSYQGPDVGSTAFETPILVVVEMAPSGEFSGAVLFAPESMDEALAELDARYAALGGDSSAQRPSELENEASRVNERGLQLLMAGDLEGHEALYSEGYEWIDRRQGMSTEVVGKREALEHARVIIAAVTDPELIECRNIAIRGERLVLARTHIRTDDWDVVLLNVVEVTEGGQLAKDYVFDADDLDGATRCLDELYAELEDEPTGDDEQKSDNECVRAARAYADAIVRGDMDAVAAMTADDAVGEDRRPMFDTKLVGKEAVLAGASGINADEIRVAVVETRGERLALLREVFVGPLGEVEVYFVWEIDDDGLVAYTGVFDLDDEAAALAELERRDAARRAIWTKPGGITNAATQALVTTLELTAAADWPALESIVTPDVSFEDRRIGLGLRIENRDAFMQAVRPIWEIAFAPGEGHVEIDPLATRGEGLALVSIDGWIGQERNDDFSLHVFAVSQTDEAGRLRSVATFDANDADDAWRELDERFAASLDPGAAETVRLARRYFDAANAFDGAAMRELLADDVVEVDHQPASWPDRVGADAVIEPVLAIEGLVPDMKMRTVRVPVATERFVVSQISITGHSPDGADVEFALTILAEFSASRIVRMEQYPAEDLDRAVTRVRERSDVAPDNSSVRTWVRACAAIERGDWDGLASLLRVDVVSETRRAGLGHVTAGRDRFIEDLQAAREVGVTRLALTPLAVRGERLALGRVIASGDHPDLYAVEMLNLLEVDEHGRLVREVLFDAEDFVEALDALDRRFIAEDGAVLAETYEDVRRFVSAYNSRDWDACAGIFRDDIAYVDHRPASHGEVRGSDRVVEISRAFSELATVRIRVERYLGVDERGVLMRMIDSGSTADGGAFEIPSLVLVERTPERRVARIERFPDEARDEALARFAATSDPTSEDGLTNACVRTVRRSIAHGLAGEWEAARRLLSEDMVMEDRRPGMGWVLEGRDAVMANAREIYRNASYSSTTLATRGERLALVSARFGVADYVVETVDVLEVDERGRHCATISFDPSDMPAAFSELDERFIAGEGAAFAESVSMFARIAAAASAHDWPEYRTMLGEDFYFVDHRAASLGEMTDRDALIAAHKTLIEVIPDGILGIARYESLAEGRALARVLIAGHSTDGGSVDLSLVGIVAWRNGLISRLEFFPLEAIDDARVRYRELGSGSRGLENASSRHLERFFDLRHRGRTDEAIAMFAEDIVWQDRRAGMGWELRGREAVGENARLVIGHGWQCRVLATRGERLALASTRLEGASFEVEALLINELGEDGLQSACVLFDIDDLDGAFEELDARFIAGEGSDRADLWRRGTAGIAMYNAHDWEAVAAAVSPEFVYVDHSPAGLGRMDGAQLVEAQRALAELLPDLRLRITCIDGVTDEALMMRVMTTGTNTEGGPAEQDLFHVWRFAGDTALSLDTYQAEQRGLAVARFEELRGPRGDGGLVNASTRLTELVIRLDAAGKRDELAALVAPDATFDDRRPGFGWVLDRDGVLENMRLTAPSTVTFETLAIRGDRLALNRVRYAVPNGFDVEVLEVMEIDSEGRWYRNVTFVPEDLDAAYTELDRRFVAQGIAAYSAGDLRTLASMATPDMVLVDHAIVGLGEIENSRRWAESQRVMRDLVTDFRARIIEEVATANGVFLVLVEILGTNAEGGELVDQTYFLLRIRDGLFDLGESFTETQRDEALARFEELTAEGREEPDRWLARVRAVSDAIVRRDWAAYRDLYVPDCIWEDRRPGMRSELVGVEKRIANAKNVADLGLREIRGEVIATRGSFLALVKHSYIGADVVLDVVDLEQLDESGRLLHDVTFELDDIDAAFAELDEWFIVGEGAEAAEWMGPVVNVMRLINARDWVGYGELFAEDVVLVDHRPASLGTVRGREEMVDFARTLAGVMPDLRWDVTEILRVGFGCIAGRLVVAGTVEGSGPNELSLLFVFKVRDRRIVEGDAFPDDAVSAVLARFDELAADSSDG